MTFPYPGISQSGGLKQAHLDWLLKSGVSVEAMVRPEAIRIAYGHKDNNGRFDDDAEGSVWLVFPEAEDVVFWQPRSGELASWNGRSFALGEEAIYEPETYAFDCNLNLFADPLEWLRAGRDGCVVLDWSRAFDRLRDCPRIAVSDSLLFLYRRHMMPQHMPETFVLTGRRKAA